MIFNWLSRLMGRLSRATSDPYLEGLHARDQGYELTSNPYAEFTEHWEDWRDGWNNACEGVDGAKL